jgi:hypothetical protein
MHRMCSTHEEMSNYMDTMSGNLEGNPEEVKG